MSKPVNATLIGAFVVGAVSILAIAVALFAGSQFFARKTMLVTYFEGSVQGLRVGSNVAFRGVRVGFVQNITVITRIDPLSPTIEVVMELTPESVKVLQDGRRLERSLVDVLTVEELVEAGFSAQLASESFVTGQLFVELDFRPSLPMELSGLDPPHPEIPGVPSEIQQALTRFRTLISDVEQNVDVAELSERVFSVLQGMDELANSAELREAITGMNRLVNAESTQQLTASLQRAIDELRATIAEAGELLRNTDEDVNALLGNLAPAAERLNATLTEAEATLAAARRQISGDTEQVYQLQSTLMEVEAAAESINEFFRYLERNPEALLRGRQP